MDDHKVSNNGDAADFIDDNFFSSEINTEDIAVDFDRHGNVEGDISYKRVRDRTDSESFSEQQPKRGREDSGGSTGPSFDSRVLWELFPPNDNIAMNCPEGQMSSLGPVTTWNFSSSDSGLRPTNSLFPDSTTFGQPISFEQFLPANTPAQNPPEYTRGEGLVKAAQKLRLSKVSVSQGSSKPIHTPAPHQRNVNVGRPRANSGRRKPSTAPNRKKKNVRERLRRAGLSQRFDQLHTLVIAAEQNKEIKIVMESQPKNKGKLSKATVLEATIDVVKALTRKVTDLAQRNNELQSQIIQLKHQKELIDEGKALVSPAKVLSSPDKPKAEEARPTAAYPTSNVQVSSSPSLVQNKSQNSSGAATYSPIHRTQSMSSSQEKPTTQTTVAM